MHNLELKYAVNQHSGVARVILLLKYFGHVRLSRVSQTHQEAVSQRLLYVPSRNKSIVTKNLYQKIQVIFKKATSNSFGIRSTCQKLVKGNRKNFDISNHLLRKNYISMHCLERYLLYQYYDYCHSNFLYNEKK